MTIPLRTPFITDRIKDEVIGSRNHQPNWEADIPEDVVKKIGNKKEQVIKDISDTYKHLKAKYNLTTDDVKNLKAAFADKTVKLEGTKDLIKHIYYNRRGVWLFDIFENRDYKNNPEDNLVKHWGIFLHGNSSFVRAYELATKSGSELRRLINKFSSGGEIKYEDYDGSIKTIDYPVRKIISDAEKGVPEEMPGLEIIKVKQTGTDHVTLSKINAFASQVRNAHDVLMKNQSVKYLTTDELNDFIYVWNKSNVQNARCTRIEMLENEDYEVAYIAGNMYHNHEVAKMAEEAFQPGDIVKYKAQQKDAQGKIIPGGYKEVPGTYRVVMNERGSTTLVDVENEKNIIEKVPVRHITARVYSVKERQDVVNVPRQHQAMLIDQIPVTKENLEEAQIYKDTRGRRAGLELVRLRQDQKEEEKDFSKANMKKLKEGTEQAGATEIQNLGGQMLTRSQAKKLKNSNYLGVDEKQLTQAQKTKVVEKIAEVHREEEFQKGIVTGWTAEEKYKIMQQYRQYIPKNIHEQLFPSTFEETWFRTGKKRFSDKQIEHLDRELKRIIEDPTYKFILDEELNKYPKEKGSFFANKPGAKSEARSDNVTEMIQSPEKRGRGRPRKQSKK